MIHLVNASLALAAVVDVFHFDGPTFATLIAQFVFVFGVELLVLLRALVYLVLPFQLVDKILELILVSEVLPVNVTWIQTVLSGGDVMAPQRHKYDWYGDQDLADVGQS